MLTQNGITITAMRSKSILKKDDALKTKNCSFVVPVYKSGMLFQRKSVRLINNLLNCGTGMLYAWRAGRFYGYTQKWPAEFA